MRELKVAQLPSTGAVRRNFQHSKFKLYTVTPSRTTHGLIKHILLDAKACFIKKWIKIMKKQLEITNVWVCEQKNLREHGVQLMQ